MELTSIGRKTESGQSRLLELAATNTLTASNHRVELHSSYRSIFVHHIKGKIREFLRPHIRESEIKDDEDLFSNGHVHSLLALSLILFVESEFKIDIPDEDLDMDKFRSFDALATFIQEKIADETAAPE